MTDTVQKAFRSRYVVIDTKIRLVSALLDMWFMTFVAMPFSIPYFIKEFFTDFIHPSIGRFDNSFHITGLMYLGLVGFALIFCKDCIYGQSFAKRQLKFQVVNNRTGQIANPIRCFVRNIFMVLWPIEAIILIANPARRLGDFVAGTKVIIFDPELERPVLNYFQLAISFLLAYAFMLLVGGLQ